MNNDNKSKDNIGVIDIQIDTLDAIDKMIEDAISHLTKEGNTAEYLNGQKLQLQQEIEELKNKRDRIIQQALPLDEHLEILQKQKFDLQKSSLVKNLVHNEEISKLTELYNLQTSCIKVVSLLSRINECNNAMLQMKTDEFEKMKERYPLLRCYDNADQAKQALAPIVECMKQIEKDKGEGFDIVKTLEGKIKEMDSCKNVVSILKDGNLDTIFTNGLKDSIANFKDNIVKLNDSKIPQHIPSNNFEKRDSVQSKNSAMLDAYNSTLRFDQACNIIKDAHYKQQTMPVQPPSVSDSSNKMSTDHAINTEDLVVPLSSKNTKPESPSKKNLGDWVEKAVKRFTEKMSSAGDNLKSFAEKYLTQKNDNDRKR